jgi:anti-sigma regulatory factor (Ser/Thr protein kinase)
MKPDFGPDQVQLRFTSDPRLLCVARASVRRFVELAGFAGKQAEDLVLAVDESLTNVIRHCYGGRTNQPIELDLALGLPEDGSLVVRLRDFGPKAPPELLAPPVDTDPETPGGLGLRLIHDVMDSVELRDGPEGGNELVLTIARPSS